MLVFELVDPLFPLLLVRLREFDELYLGIFELGGGFLLALV